MFWTCLAEFMPRPGAEDTEGLIIFPDNRCCLVCVLDRYNLSQLYTYSNDEIQSSLKTQINHERLVLTVSHCCERDWRECIRIRRSLVNMWQVICLMMHPHCRIAVLPVPQVLSGLWRSGDVDPLPDLTAPVRCRWAVGLGIYLAE